MSKSKKGDHHSEKALRKALVATARQMSESGLSPGRSGNVSCRLGDGMLITPTGRAYDDMEAVDIAFVGHDGSLRTGEAAPSTEWRFHLAAYAARPDRSAAVHAHSLNATVLACMRRPIPAFHYMVAVAGGSDIPCVPYATFGTEALAANVASGLKDRDACLMGNHGQIALGCDLKSALELSAEVETLAAQYVKALTLGLPHILSDAEMADVLERFASYGQRAAEPRKTS